MSNATEQTAADRIAELQARPCITREQTAELYGVSVPTVDRAIARGELLVLRIGRRVLIARDAHRAWVGLDG